MTIDTSYYYRSLLLQTGGADGATTFTDTSARPKTPTVNGNAQLDTGNQLFGTASMLFDGTGDYLAYAADADFGFESGPYIVEGWLYQGAETTDRCLFDNRVSSAVGIAIYSSVTGGTTERRLSLANNSAIIAGGSTTQLAVNTWQHWLVSRGLDGNVRGFIDGVLVWTVADTRAYAASAGVTVAASGTASATYLGALFGVRVTKGEEVTATFTPPTALFPDEAPPDGVIELAVSVPALTFAFYTGPSLDAAMPALTLEFYTGPSLDAAMPALQFAGQFGGALDATLPMVQTRIVAHDATGENALDVSLPAITFEALGGARIVATLPGLEFEGDATGTNMATLDASMPMLQASIAGTVSATAQIDATLPMASMVGYGGALLSVTLGAVEGELEASAGAVGSLVATLPLFEVDLEASAQAYGTLDVVLPALQSGPYLQMWATLPMVQMVAVGSATVTASYEAYALNLNHKGARDSVDELTRYTNFPFTHVVRYRNSYFGVADTGLYLLEGTTDYAPATPTVPTKIPWAWKTGMTDFGSPNKKNVQSAYFGGRLGPSVTVTLYVGESASQAHRYRTVRGADAQTYRQRFGQGNSARYYALGMAGDEELSLDTIDFNIAELARRI